MYEWDTMCPSEQWKYSHNYVHHTFTNVLGKDRDIGYGVLRMDEDQEWRPYYLGNPLYATLLMLFFEWGVLLHDLEVEEIAAGRAHLGRHQAPAPRDDPQGPQPDAQGLRALPGADRPAVRAALVGNATANLVRNVWAFGIIFCGHFPAGVATFSEEETEDETRGRWYVRQLLGSANITGSRLFHVMTGNLSHQIEHHLFPDIPARRYPDDRPRGAGAVREVRPGLQHRPALAAARQRRAEDLPARAADPAPPEPEPVPDTVDGLRRLRETARVVEPARWYDLGWSTERHGGRMRDRISKGEIRKDALQDTVEATATAVGAVTAIVTTAVRDIARTVGGFATEVFEIRDAARRAADDNPPDPPTRPTSCNAGLWTEGNPYAASPRSITPRYKRPRAPGPD